MDLNSPFNFNIAAIQWIYTPQGIVFAEKIQKGHKALSNNQEEQEISNNLAIGNQKTYQLNLVNGNSILIGEQLKVYTLGGWKNIKDISPSDYVLSKMIIHNLNNNKGGNVINYIQKMNTNAMPIYVPKKNSTDFSEWLGIYLSIGSMSLTNGKIWIVCDDEKIIQRYYELTNNIFRLKPIKTQNKRENRKSEYYFVSKNVVNFLKDFTGNLAHLKKIPSFLLEGSNQEHLSFIKGMSANAQKEKNNMIIYRGISKNLAECVALILRNNGYIISQKKISYKHSENNKKDYYIVKILGKHPLAKNIEMFQEHFKFNNDLNVIVDISKIIKTINLRSFDAGYSVLQILKKKNKTTCTWKVAKKLGVDDNELLYYFEKVSSVVELKNAIKHINVKTLYTNGLLINNVVIQGNY